MVSREETSRALLTPGEVKEPPLSEERVLACGRGGRIEIDAVTGFVLDLSEQDHFAPQQPRAVTETGM
jgi:hypothetical protein